MSKLNIKVIKEYAYMFCRGEAKDIEVTLKTRNLQEGEIRALKERKKQLEYIELLLKTQ